MIDNLRDAIEREREQLLAERADYEERCKQAHIRIAEVNRELAAIHAYEVALTVPIKKTNGAAPPSSDAPRRRGRRSGHRAVVLDLLTQSDIGLTRGDILRHLELHGDKSGEMSVSNALMALLKSGQVVRSDGRYQTALTSTRD